jgi:hypothetical protein
MTDICQSDYRILVSCSHTRPKAELYGFNLPEPISSVPIPLAINDSAPLLKLQPLIDEIYERGGYALQINDQDSPVPQVSEQTAGWLVERWQQAGRR